MAINFPLPTNGAAFTHTQLTPQYYALCAKVALDRGEDHIAYDLLDIIANYNSKEAEESFNHINFKDPTE